MRIFVVVLVLLAGFQSFSQNIKPLKKQIQLSGVLVTGDSLKAVQGASIKITKTDSIDYSYFFSVPTDKDGFFVLMAKPGDVIGFKKESYADTNYVIPDTLKATHFDIVQIIRRDTFTLKEVNVYPWPSKEDFKADFLKRNVANTDLDRAKQNLAAEEMRELIKGVSMDAYGNYRYAMQQQYNKMYYMGQYPPNNLLNPLAWAQFIKALKAGKLKIQ